MYKYVKQKYAHLTKNGVMSRGTKNILWCKVHPLKKFEINYKSLFSKTILYETQGIIVVSTY